MPMPSVHPLHSPSLANPFRSTNTHKFSSNKSPTNNLALPQSSKLLPPQGPADINKNGLAHSIQKKGTTFLETHYSLPFNDERLEKKDCRLRVQNFVDAIRGLPSKEDIESLKFLRKGCTLVEFNSFLMASVIANEPDLALKMYSNMLSYGLVPNSWTFSIMVRCYCKKNSVAEAKRVLDHMVEHGFNPDFATFTILINSLSKRGQLKRAFEAVELMERIGYKPNIQIYNCLLKGLCYVGKVEEAFELMVDINKSSLEPDIYTYTALMDGFCKVGRSDEAMELLNEALEMGLTPNVISFNTLFHGYAKEGRPMKGFGVLRLMKERNCVPDQISYSTFLNGLLIWGKIDSGHRVFKEMVRNGFEVHETLLNRLVRGFCRKFLKGNGLLNDAYELFEKMKKRACGIDRDTYAMVIQALCTAKKIDDALLNLLQMIRLGYIPRVITMNNVIRVFCVEGMVDKAILVLVLMYENGKIPTRMSYDHLIRELNRQGRFLHARGVYAAALARGLVPHEKLQ